ncbi:MAG TPA: 3'(2'),5'-bisphosphate nucleotidase CysQ [Prolixibacteraceae bacterium]|nr:3'(2'),5'-bisphosphate nucleotidase CysQ [Prolixibacteraceae bacterium]
MGIQQLMDIAIKAALLAGEKIMEVYASGDFGTEQKADFTPITIADRQAHQTIATLLESTQLPMLSEEGIHLPFTVRKHWTSFWLVDPLDGTKEFIKRNGEFTVNIALIENGSPIAGIIYAPVTRELHVGIVGSGAWKLINPKADCTLELLKNDGIRLPQIHETHPFTVAISRSHLNQQTSNYLEELRKLHPDMQMTRIGSSLKFCLIAEGAADCYPRFGPIMEWDTAAGHALVKSVGKNVYLMDQQTEIHYNKENLKNPSFIVL